jgi:hypothetical protein
VINQFRTKLTYDWPCSMRTMSKSLSVWLREAADYVRDLALRAPEIANELRRLADDLEEAADAEEGDGRRQRDDAAE